MEPSTDAQPEQMHGVGGDRLARRARVLLEHRWAPVVLTLLAVVIMLPALDEGLLMDDLHHRMRVIDPVHLPEDLAKTGLLRQDSGSLKAALRDMHSLVRTPEDRERTMEYGVIPWWTHPDFRAANFRPLDAFSHWLDYQLYPDKYALMHAHSIAWFAGVVLLLAILYRRVCAPLVVAAVAGFLFVIDENNYFPVMWVANRNLLHALLFSLLSILAHVRWREAGSRFAAVVSPVCLLLSLLSTEAGIATMAYLVSYALFLDRGSWKRRLASLLPGLGVIVAWRIAYNLLGFGATGGGLIIDPVREPLAFAQAVLVRGPRLLFGLIGSMPAEYYDMVGDRAKALCMAVAVGLLLVFALAFVPLLRKDRAARFWCVAMLFCIVPICASVPMNRNLLFAAIGGCALIGTFIVGVIARRSWLPSARWKNVSLWIVCVVLILIHGPGAIVGRLGSARTMPFVFNLFHATCEAPAGTPLQDKTLVVVNAPQSVMSVLLPVLNAWRGEPFPDRIRVLSSGLGPRTIERPEPKVLIISASEGNLFALRIAREHYQPHLAYLYAQFNALVRSQNSQSAVGERVAVEPITAEVLEVDTSKKPTRVKITFDVPLDSPDLVWLQWNWGIRGTGHYTHFELPAVGESTSLDGPF